MVRDALPAAQSQSRGVSPQFDGQPGAGTGAGKRHRGLFKLPMTNALGNSKLSHSTSSLASHIRSGSDLGGCSTKLSENLHQIFHPHSGSGPHQQLSSQHHQQTTKVLKGQPVPTTTSQPHLIKTQISDPYPGVQRFRPPLSKSATTSSIIFPVNVPVASSPPRTNSQLQFDIVSHLSIGRYKEFLEHQPETPHNLKRIWATERSPKGNQPKYYQSLLSGKFPMRPKFARRGRRSSKLSPFKEYRKLRNATKRKYQGKFNALLAKKLGLRKEAKKINKRAQKSYPSIFSRQSSNEDYAGTHSLGHSLENIFQQGLRRANKVPSTMNLPLTQKSAYPPKTKRPNLKSMFGGSCGNIYEKSKRRNSGFEQPPALYSMTYNNTIIGLESLKPKMGTGFKSPRSFLGIGDFDIPGEDLQPIRDDDGFSDVGFEGTFEEDGDTEAECTMDFDTESMSSEASSVEVSAVNEYRYRTSRPLTQNPLYITDSSSSCSCEDMGKGLSRNKRTKKGSRKTLVAFRADLSSSRRSSGTDMELLLTQKQKQGQFRNVGRVTNLPPKWSPSQEGLNFNDGKRIVHQKNKNRRGRDKFDVYETLNEELIFFKNEYRQQYDRGFRPGSDDRFLVGRSSHSKASSTVPHSRTGSPCSVNSLHMTPRSNTPTHFQMHFNPIHPVAGVSGTGTLRRSREPPLLQKVSPFGITVRGGSLKPNIASQSLSTGGQQIAVSVGGVGGTNPSNTLPEQKLSVRTTH